MLDLDARIDLEEGHGAVIAQEELAGGKPAQVNGLANPPRGGMEQAARGGVQIRRRRFFDNLLVAALERAVAITQGDHPPAIAGDLHLDVTRIDQCPFEVDAVAGVRRRRFPPRGGDGLDQLRLVGNLAQPAPAAGFGRFDDERVADITRRGEPLRRRVAERRTGRQDGDAGSDRDCAGGQLVAAQAQGGCRRSDEADPGGLARLGQGGALAEETVPRMQEVRLDALRGGDDALDVELRPRFAKALDAADPSRGEPVKVRLTQQHDRDGAEAGAGVGDPNGDFGAVRDRYSFAADRAHHVGVMFAVPQFRAIRVVVAGLSNRDAVVHATGPIRNDTPDDT